MDSVMNHLIAYFKRIPRRMLILATTGFGTFAIVIGILALLLPGATPPAHHAVAKVYPTSTATNVPTDVPTVTPVPPTATPIKLVVAPTATPIPHPLPVPQSAPPPAHNPAPPIPTATPVPPTATAVPPTATAIPPTATAISSPGNTTPCGGSTTCGTPSPSPTPLPPSPTATATLVPPTATPGPCQPGGAPYYSTPTTLPSNSDIANALSQSGSQSAIPTYLMDAIAWQESGWQPNIIACDGGIGLMQIMPNTASWLNTYYHTNYDPYSYTGSAYLGAQYLQYYYLFYTNYLQQNDPAACGSGGCSWTTVWPGGKATVLDIVISVYNEGAGTMGTYGIVNCSYVQNVLLWISSRYAGPQYSYICGT